MKKTYIQPISDLILMESENMIATSINPGDSHQITPDEGDYEGDFMSSKKDSEFPWE